ncbi:MAG: hypothetical protein PWP24_939 [Clostridiales bacterium]|nr:hypothetical protein [Clostridiales bacterium]
MRKILLRAAMSPVLEYTEFDVVAKNLVGNNIGNMLFAASMAKTLLTPDTQIDTISTSRRYSKEEIKRFNEQYECFVIPLANAFRASFVKELGHLTDLVSKLKIPCIVAGVGIQAKLETNVEKGFSFDEDVKRFMNAILEKSALVGVRGEITGAYLKRLGYEEERHFTVIGCPSMYLFGKELPKTKESMLTEKSRVSINFKLDLSEKMHALFERSMKEIPDHYFIPQSIEELRLMYAGVPYPTKKKQKIPAYYPIQLDTELYQNNRVRSFVNVESWLGFLSEMEFSFGSRIHGNIAAILSGIPCYIFAYDNRITELAAYHQIPYMDASRINKKTNILDIYEKTDFSCIHKGQEERFFHFLDFLNQNQLEHIYDESGHAKYTIYDELRKNQTLAAPIIPFTKISVREQEQRLALYYQYQERRYERLKKEKLETESLLAVKSYTQLRKWMMAWRTKMED